MKLTRIVLMLAAVMFGGCDAKKPPPLPVLEKPAEKKAEPAAAAAAAAAPADADAAAVKEAADIFANRCAACHGVSGKGDGAAAAALNPPPRNYTDAKWQAETTDEQIEKIIVGGGPSVGKSPLMPPNPDLAGKAAVVSALRKRIRGFGGK